MNGAALGDWESIMCFGCLGFALYPAEGEEAVRKAYADIRQAGHPVLYVTETAWTFLPEGEQGELTVIPIPGLTGPREGGKRALSGLVRQAIGSDILFGGGRT